MKDSASPSPTSPTGPARLLDVLAELLDEDGAQHKPCKKLGLQFNLLATSSCTKARRASVATSTRARAFNHRFLGIKCVRRRHSARTWTCSIHLLRNTVPTSSTH